MSLGIESVRAAKPEEWDSTWGACEYATYFQSRTWAELWQHQSRGSIKTRPELVAFSDGKSAIVPICTTLTLGGLSEAHLLSPGGTYGGWISSEGLADSHKSLIVRHILRKSNIIWRWSPYETALPPLGVSDFTQSVKISGDFESLLKKWSKGHRSAAAKAHREGVIVSIARSEFEWQKYFEVYQETIQRWDKGPTMRYSLDFFKRLRIDGEGSVKLWIARYEGSVIAGAVVLYARRHASYWHGSALGSHFHLRPVHLLMREAIRHAFEHNYRWFDLNPSGQIEGVKAFKSGFAPEILFCPIIKNETTLVRLARALDPVARFVRRKMPS